LTRSLESNETFLSAKRIETLLCAAAGVTSHKYRLEVRCMW